jgi:hypothetical protein
MKPVIFSWQKGSVAKNILATFHSNGELPDATTSCMVSEFLQQIRTAKHNEVNYPPGHRSSFVGHLKYTRTLA